MKPDSVELTMALEEELEGPLQKRLTELQAYLVEPYQTLCIKGGFQTEVAVYAQHANAVFFVILETLRFGAGTTNEFGDIIESHHYPNVTMATRSFLGLVNEQS